MRAIYQLAEEIERQGGTNSDSEFQELIQKILAARPDNLAALLELSRIAAKRGDAATLKSAISQISARSSAWPSEVQRQLAIVQSAAAGPDLHAAATQTTFLRNVLVRVPEYRLSLKAIKAAPGEEAEPFTHFLLMESPVFKSAQADTALTFDPQPIATLGGSRWSWIGAIPLGSAGSPAIAVANGREVRLSTGATFPFPGGSSAVAPLPEGIVPLDFNYDFKTDLVLAGAGGVRLLAQDSPNVFRDVTVSRRNCRSRSPTLLIPERGRWTLKPMEISISSWARAKVYPQFCETMETARFCRNIPLPESPGFAALLGRTSMETEILTQQSLIEPASFISS